VSVHNRSTAGCPGHTSFAQGVTAPQLAHLAAMVGVEFIRIGQGTEQGLPALETQFRWNDAAYGTR